MKKNQQGFALVEVLLLLLLVSFISFAGWYVWNAQHDKTTVKTHPTSNSRSSQNEAKTTAQTDPTKDWLLYTDIDGKFSLKYPPTWSTATSPDLCGNGLFLVGPTPETVGKCATDNAGQILVASYPADNNATDLDEQYYTDIKTTSIKVDGVTGERQSGTYSNADQLIGPANGSEEIVYVFKTNGLIYKANYTQEPSYPDVQKEFDLMVTKTLHFK